MKKFRFRLERVLSYRNLVRDDKKRELFESYGVLHRAEARLGNLNEAALRNKVDDQEPLPVERFLLTGLFSTRLKSEIENQRLAIIEAENQAQEALKNYIEAAKDSKSLEMLRERKLHQYLEEYEREEEKQRDEVAIQRGYRQQKAVR
ncbi:MAG: flagellar export protein FliJ [Proteobacteria bacterium]|nr:MAG: flagellar export protein FliJ [Pseudomonadota bacterium]